FSWMAITTWFMVLRSGFFAIGPELFDPHAPRVKLTAPSAPSVRRASRRDCRVSKSRCRSMLLPFSLRIYLLGLVAELYHGRASRANDNGSTPQLNEIGSSRA